MVENGMENKIVAESQEATLYDAVVQRGLRILNKEDFAEINKRIEITRDGALKILSSLPLSYEMEILEQELKDTHALVKVRLTIEFHKTGIRRTGIGTGICEKWEVSKGKDFSLHNMITKAETRALKRAIEVCLGGIINAIILKLFGSYQVGGGR